jgi:hypothetical protein
MDKIVVRKENGELNIALYQKNNSNETFNKITEIKRNGNGNSVELAIESFNILIYPHLLYSNSNKENKEKRIEIIRKEIKKTEEEIDELENMCYHYYKDNNERDKKIEYKEKLLEYLKEKEKEAENSEEIIIDYISVEKLTKTFKIRKIKEKWNIVRFGDKEFIMTKELSDYFTKNIYHGSIFHLYSDGNNIILEECNDPIFRRYLKGSNTILEEFPSV